MNARALIVLNGVATKNNAAGSSDLDAARAEAGVEVGIVVVIDGIALDQNARIRGLRRGSSSHPDATANPNLAVIVNVIVENLDAGSQLGLR